MRVKTHGRIVGGLVPHPGAPKLFIGLVTDYLWINRLRYVCDYCCLSQELIPKRSEEDKHKPDFKTSGLLAAATNTVHRSDGTKTLLKYNEPPEARKPTDHWRLYDFEDEKDPGESLPLYRCLFLTFPL